MLLASAQAKETVVRVQQLKRGCLYTCLAPIKKKTEYLTDEFQNPHDQINDWLYMQSAGRVHHQDRDNTVVWGKVAPQKHPPLLLTEEKYSVSLWNKCTLLSSLHKHTASTFCSLLKKKSTFLKNVEPKVFRNNSSNIKVLLL